MTATRLFVLAGMMATLGASVAAQELPKSVSSTVVPQSYGRYQIVISPFTERSTYLLDTETGSVWQLEPLTALNGDPLAWDLMPRVNNEDDMARLVSKFGKKGVRSGAPRALSPEPRQ